MVDNLFISQNLDIAVNANIDCSVVGVGANRSLHCDPLQSLCKISPTVLWGAGCSTNYRVIMKNQ